MRQNRPDRRNLPPSPSRRNVVADDLGEIIEQWLVLGAQSRIAGLEVRAGLYRVWPARRVATASHFFDSESVWPRNCRAVMRSSATVVSSSVRFPRAAIHSNAIATSLATVFMLRAVPFFAAGILSFESAMPSP